MCVCVSGRGAVSASEVDPFKWHFQWLKAFEDQQVGLEMFWAVNAAPWFGSSFM